MPHKKGNKPIAPAADQGRERIERALQQGRTQEALELVRQFTPEKHPEKFAAIRPAYDIPKVPTPTVRECAGTAVRGKSTAPALAGAVVRSRPDRSRFFAAAPPG